VLWEIGEDGRDVRALRARLGLDSGYLSRLLRSLEAARLVEVGPADGDHRVRVARLTAAGRCERRLLDRRSDELARSFLAPLGAPQRERLVAAMAEVDRLLTAGVVEVTATDPARPDAQACLEAYFRELDARFQAGFDPALARGTDLDGMRPPRGLFLVARLGGEAIGCGALRFHGRRPAEIKRMWVSERARGLGLGRRLLTELEQAAAAHGVRTVRLDTNGTLVEAIAMYRSAGYHEIPPFNDEHYATLWFEKRLGG
jgi:DNA-binding MarR family transcriptional regulator/GNAT superfamily N-acetyltransferase